MKRAKQVVNERYAKGKGEYEKVIGAIASRGHCPFCPANFKYHKKPILKRRGQWFITENSWPYKNTDKHFVIISLKHKERFSDLTNADFEAVRALVNWAVKKFRIRGGALALRFGDTDCTGATVCHLHWQLIYPKRDRRGLAKTVNFPVG